jgi:hypothetical protein
LKLYETEVEPGELGPEIIKIIEAQEDKKVFTLRFLEDRDEEMDILIVFDDRSILTGTFSLLPAESGEIGVRVQANYI